MGSDRAPSPCGCLAWAPILLLAGAFRKIMTIETVFSF
jgi:hypothetical protein